MPEPYRRTYEDDYRRGSRRGWSDRFREEARPWLRDEDSRWRQDEPRWRQDEDERSATGSGGRSWRDQGDGAYERASRARDLERSGAASFERDRGATAREDRDYGRRPSGNGRDEGRGEKIGRGRSEEWRENGREDSLDRLSSPSADERYRQWRGSFYPEYFDSGYRADESAARGDVATQAGYRSGGAGSAGRMAREDAGRWRGNGFAGRGPKGYQRSDDRIKEDLCEHLMDDPDIDATEVTVEVAKGEVTLTGTVADRWQKRRAEDIADSVPGVCEVANNIRLSRHEPGQDSRLTSGQTTSGIQSSSSPASGSSKATKPTNSAV
jgi:hypothetical protein